MIITNIHEGFFRFNILYWGNWLHHVDECVLSLYLATEHNRFPISIEQFQKGTYTRFLHCHGEHPFKRVVLIKMPLPKGK